MRDFDAQVSRAVKLYSKNLSIIGWNKVQNSKTEIIIYAKNDKNEHLHFSFDVKKDKLNPISFVQYCVKFRA